ncbi:hypothetical protein [Shinella sp. BYT-45]|uniref:hypothetical protein n=1 Tax=Shinella sp. BYT-45 TaxID=3377377 RepID=UPI00397EE463
MSRAFVNPLARRAAGVVNKARTVKQWTRELLALPEDAVVSVNELVCHLPGCPPKETVVLVMHAGRIAQASIHKAMADLTRDDVAHACPALVPEPGRPFPQTR